MSLSGGARSNLPGRRGIIFKYISIERYFFKHGDVRRVRALFINTFSHALSRVLLSEKLLVPSLRSIPEYVPVGARALSLERQSHRRGEDRSN